MPGPSNVNNSKPQPPVKQAADEGFSAGLKWSATALFGMMAKACDNQRKSDETNGSYYTSSLDMPVSNGSDPTGQKLAAKTTQYVFGNGLQKPQNPAKK